MLQDASKKGQGIHFLKKSGMGPLRTEAGEGLQAKPAAFTTIVQSQADSPSTAEALIALHEFLGIFSARFQNHDGTRLRRAHVGASPTERDRDQQILPFDDPRIWSLPTLTLPWFRGHLAFRRW
ncbi:MAG: hypothetical protein ACYCXS_11885 [Acidiferrobacter sp.]